MKIIGEAKSRNYICEVSHSELEKFLGQYYGNLKSLKVGDVVDLATGHDFFADTQSALKTTADFVAKHQKITDTIMKAIGLFGVD